MSHLKKQKARSPSLLVHPPAVRGSSAGHCGGFPLKLNLKLNLDLRIERWTWAKPDPYHKEGFCIGYPLLSAPSARGFFPRQWLICRAGNRTARVFPTTFPRREMASSPFRWAREAPARATRAAALCRPFVPTVPTPGPGTTHHQSPFQEQNFSEDVFAFGFEMCNLLCFGICVQKNRHVNFKTQPPPSKVTIAENWGESLQLPKTYIHVFMHINT